MTVNINDLSGRRRAGCQIAVEFLDPDKHTEIYWVMDQVGTNGYVRPASEWKAVKTLEAGERRSGDGPGHKHWTISDLRSTKGCGQGSWLYNQKTGARWE